MVVKKHIIELKKLKMNKHNKCLICNSSNIGDLKNYTSTHLVKCSDCSFVFSERIPTTEELIKHYEGYGRDEFLSPITIKRYHEILDTFEPFRKTNKLIDVGCGIGYFLEVAKERGWDVYGTEFTDKAVEICTNKGIKMNQGVLNPNDYQENSFDIITSFEVLEHINNPQEEIVNFKNILRKDGLLFFTTPNFNATERFVLKSRYSVITYPEHLSYYTKKSMNHLLKNKGFEKVKITTTGISLSLFKKSLAKKPTKHIGPNTVDEKIRTAAENSMSISFLKNTLNQILNFLGIGNSLKGYYTKK